jgi:peptidoglycan/xylan/chitin deacetylase (PgdA/CDA1 family)
MTTETSYAGGVSWKALPLAALIALAGAAPAAARERPVPILMYHHVAAPPGPDARRLWVRPARFARQIDALAHAGYRAVTLRRVWRAWHGRASLPARPVVLTFDDGYADQASNAAPVLAARGWPGVLYLIARNLDDEIAGDDVRALMRSGWEIGAHTLTHPDLTRVGARRLAREVGGSRTRLEDELGVPVRSFAYPFGRSTATVRAAVRSAGFHTATTVRFGAAMPSDDPLALRRIRVGDDVTTSSLLRRIGRARRRALSR